MKSIDTWLDEYGESHQNPVNKTIHWVAVPIIYVCVFGLIWDIPTPDLFSSPLLNWATIILVPVMAFYFVLSMVIGLAMTIFSALMVLLVAWYDGTGISSVSFISIVLFVIMWIFQFVGHAIEGKKPSFFKDVQFLLIGPIWLMADFLRRIGIRY